MYDTMNLIREDNGTFYWPHPFKGSVFFFFLISSPQTNNLKIKYATIQGLVHWIILDSTVGQSIKIKTLVSKEKSFKFLNIPEKLYSMTEIGSILT